LLPVVVGDVLHLGGVVFFCIATLLTVSSGTQYMVKYWSIFTGQNEDAQ
jgi:phosphatidylglycerophosphate synthase